MGTKDNSSKTSAFLELHCIYFGYQIELDIMVILTLALLFSWLDYVSSTIIPKTWQELIVCYLKVKTFVEALRAGDDMSAKSAFLI